MWKIAVIRTRDLHVNSMASVLLTTPHDNALRCYAGVPHIQATNLDNQPYFASQQQQPVLCEGRASNITYN